MRIFLWSLKLGGVLNLYFLGSTFLAVTSSTNPHLLIPAQIFFAVSAFRCFFPIRYKDNIVFHDSIFSSIFLTRSFATFSELALIYQLAYLIRLLNFKHVYWVNIFSWLMVALVLVSQFFVWRAILSQIPKYYFYEELGWALLYFLNLSVSIYLYATLSFPQSLQILIYINILFGFVYLPWQLFRLRNLYSSAQQFEKEGKIYNYDLNEGLLRSIQIRNPSTEFQAWGGITGIIWMAAYWAILLPIWVFQILNTLSSH